ncbi:hypothetical protein ACS0TY_027856 [Phlomoides rotata]
MKELNINISMQQAYRAKTKALKIIEGFPDEQYYKLWDYAQELRNSNLNSTIILDNDEEGRFRGMYLCFDAVKRGFKSGCRPFIVVDGYWLKGPHGGILLSVVGVDPNPADFVDACYKVETYKRVYEPAILPISGQNEWAPTLFIPSMPPSFGRKIGRPSTARRIDPEEKSSKKSKKVRVVKMRRRQTSIKCRKCGINGHNARACTQVADGEPVQVYVPETGQENEQYNVQKHVPEPVPTRQKLKVTAATGKKRGRHPKISIAVDRRRATTETHGDNNLILSPKPSLSLMDKDDQEFEALLSQALLNQANNASDFQSLGMPLARTSLGPTPFQQLHNDFTTPSMPRIHSGPSIRAPPPFVHGSLRPQFTTQSREESYLWRIVVDGGNKYLSLSQESRVSETGSRTFIKPHT